MREEVKTELIEYNTPAGHSLFYERYEVLIAVAEFSYSRSNREFCRDCDMHGRNLACPPYSPIFTDFIGQAREALVICIRVPSDRSEHPLLEDRYEICYREASDLLVNELLSYRRMGYAVAGAGACTGCERCAALTQDKTCTNPARRIYSLESMGVNVVDLARRCFNLDLEWSSESHIADFISTLGAVFPAQGAGRFAHYPAKSSKTISL